MSNQLEQAISMIKSGDPEAGQHLLIQYIKSNPNNEVAWMWLATVVKDRHKKKQCLQNALKINPNNETAKRGLAKLEVSTVQEKGLNKQIAEPGLQEIMSSEWPSDPWFTIWVRPRDTIRRIVSADPNRYVHTLAILGGISRLIIFSPSVNLGNILPLPFSLLPYILLGVIGGLISLYIAGAIFRLTASLFSGRASMNELLAAIAWSMVPEIWALVLLLPKLIIFGNELFTNDTPIIDNNPTFALVFDGFTIIETVLRVWGVIIFVACYSAVNRFSIWKATAAALIPFALFFLCSFVYWLWQMLESLSEMAIG
jgi:hypothetical protein